jgi:hypothetical protein
MKLEPNECKEKFEVYERVTRGNGITTETIRGSKAGKPGFIHKEVNEYGSFEETPTRIPKGYRKISQKKIHRYVDDWACKKRKTKKQKKTLANSLKGALDSAKWYNSSRKYWLTLKDFETMKKGSKIVVLSLHQNSMDAATTYFKENTPYYPEKFFKSEKDTITYQGNMQVGSKHLNEPDNKSWGLDIEYAKNKWSTLFDGNLHSKGNTHSPKHWSKFNPSTPVGYRGPMILWSDLKKLPKIYYTS